ncbi:hypothetical protein M2281_001359 [Mesorhizobium soli]|nr:hypothetical protein [Mesorhizobium soli]
MDAVGQKRILAVEAVRDGFAPKSAIRIDFATSWKLALLA